MKNRRQFLRSSSLALGGLALSFSPSSYARIIGSNSRIQVGLVGFSQRTKHTLAPSLLQYSKELNFDLVGVSDIWRLRREEGEAYIKEKTGRSKVIVARNNEELYERKEIDAVIIGTADFQHALHGVEAVRAGRDAYIEKPLANTMEDAKAILKAVKETGRIVQIGTQRRSGENYQIANEYIRSGKFGKILSVELMWNVNQPGRWRLPDLVAKCKEEDTDWKRFLMNRPFEPFDPRKYCEYRLFWPYSSGIPCQWMVHQIDTVHWFSGLTHPRSVVANGGIYQWHDGRRNFDTLTAVFDYGPADEKSGGFQVIYSSRMHNSAGGIKELYYSNGGMLNLETNKVSAEGGLDEKSAKTMGLQPNLLEEFSLAASSKVETAANTGADPVSAAHVRNWMECVRNRKQPNASIEAGYHHSVALCMTIAAIQTGKRISFDEAKQEIVIN